MSNAESWVVVWKISLIILNALCFILALILYISSKKRDRVQPEEIHFTRLVRILGLVFVSVALYRSVFIARYDGRLAWYNTVFNSPFIIRCLACFAEISFIGMIAAILLRQNKTLHLITKERSFLSITPYISFGCITFAQFFAFSTLIFQFPVFLFLEELLWGIAFLLITPLVFIGLRALKTSTIMSKSSKAFFIIMTLWCVGYALYQWAYALPFNYFPKGGGEVTHIVPPDALKQAIVNFNVTKDINRYGGFGFVSWFTGYFSICVGMSLLFMTAPGCRQKVSEKE